MEELTAKDLDNMLPGELIATGTTENSPEGVYMTDSRKGDTLIWIARVGGAHDWCIYLDWEENGYEHCATNGQKTVNDSNIQKLVPCDKEALSRYRK